MYIYTSFLYIYVRRAQGHFSGAGAIFVSDFRAPDQDLPQTPIFISRIFIREIFIRRIFGATRDFHSSADTEARTMILRLR